MLRRAPPRRRAEWPLPHLGRRKVRIGDVGCRERPVSRVPALGQFQRLSNLCAGDGRAFQQLWETPHQLCRGFCHAESSTSPTVEVPELDASIHPAGHNAIRVLVMKILWSVMNTQSISSRCTADHPAVVAPHHAGAHDGQHFVAVTPFAVHDGCNYPRLDVPEPQRLVLRLQASLKSRRAQHETHAVSRAAVYGGHDTRQPTHPTRCEHQRRPQRTDCDVIDGVAMSARGLQA